MSLMLKLIELNIPLSRWREYENDTTRTTGAGFFWGKNPQHTVDKIVNSLSHPDAVDLVARELKDPNFSSAMRSLIVQTCNDARGNRSNNVTKGILALDKKMGGAILVEKHFAPTERVLTENGWSNRRVDPAIAGAERKKNELLTRKDTSSLSKAEKRKERKREKQQHA